MTQVQIDMYQATVVFDSQAWQSSISYEAAQRP
jgi:hypothetical protein